MELREALARVAERRDLTEDEAAAVMDRIFAGEATPAQIGALLIALRMKGETAAEIAGAARAMRARALPVRCDDPRAVDTCGTGGDGARTINVSTIAALVVAACGVTVAKHGNRALSSSCGSADVLEELGVRVDAPPEVAERCLREAHVAFLFAPAYHSATRHAAAPRRELGLRTIFNALGPLTNPAGVRRQVVGVYGPALLEPVALALGALGAARALVVHGAGGIDEIAVAGETAAAEWRDGRLLRRTLRPDDFGLAEHDPAGLRGGAPAENARAVHAVLDGEPGAPRAATVLAAAAALQVAADEELRAAARRAEAAIDSGAARETLARLVAVSRG